MKHATQMTIRGLERPLTKGAQDFVLAEDANSVGWKDQSCGESNLGCVMVDGVVAGWVDFAPAGRKDLLLHAVKRAMGGSIIQPPPSSLSIKIVLVNVDLLAADRGGIHQPVQSYSALTENSVHV